MDLGDGVEGPFFIKWSLDSVPWDHFCSIMAKLKMLYLFPEDF